MSLPSAALFGLAMIALLFAVAAVVEGRAGLAVRRPWLRHGAYTLALGVYCSSWTFYGAVGSIVRDGWQYLPIYLAPICLLLGAPRFCGGWRKPSPRSRRPRCPISSRRALAMMAAWRGW